MSLSPQSACVSCWLSLRTGSVTPLELDEIERSEESEKNFWQELEAVVSWLRGFACIVCHLVATRD